MPYDPSLAYAVEEEKGEQSEEEILKAGLYNFQTVSCKEGFTQEQKPKVTLIIDIFDDKGKKWRHFFHLVTDNKYSLFLLKRYWDSVGHPEMFEQMSMVHDELAFEGKCGRIKTKIIKDDYKVKGGQKSTVDFFMKSDEKLKEPEKIAFLDDDIPF